MDRAADLNKLLVWTSHGTTLKQTCKQYYNISRKDQEKRKGKKWDFFPALCYLIGLHKFINIVKNLTVYAHQQDIFSSYLCPMNILISFRLCGRLREQALWLYRIFGLKL